MKKLTFALACVIGIMFFASCDPESNILDQKPNIVFVNEEGYVSDFSGFWVGTELNFKFKASPNEISGSTITGVHFAITDLSGNTVKTADPEIANPGDENVFVETFVSDAPSTYTVTATVTDALGKSNAVAFTVDYVEPIDAVLGKFQGKILLSGHVQTDKPIFGATINEDFVTDSLYTEIVMGSIEGDRFVATFDIDGRPVSLYGHRTQDENGDHYVFDEFHFNKTIVGININITVNATADSKDGVMTMTGTIAGTGVAYTSLMVKVTATLNGDLNGKFNQVEINEE